MLQGYQGKERGSCMRGEETSERPGGARSWKVANGKTTEFSAIPRDT